MKEVYKPLALFTALGTVLGISLGLAGQAYVNGAVTSMLIVLAVGIISTIRESKKGS